MDRKNPCYLLCVAVTVKLVFKVLAAPPLISKQKKRLHRSQRHIKLLNHFVFYLSFFISFIHVCVCARARECLVLPFLLSFFAASFLFLPLLFIPSHILFYPPSRSHTFISSMNKKKRMTDKDTDPDVESGSQKKSLSVKWVDGKLNSKLIIKL